MNQAEALKAIKRINQRLAEFEKQGLTEARTYKNLITEIKTSGLPLTQSRSGNVRLSRSKFSLSTVIQKEDIIKKIDEVGSLKTEIAKAKEAGMKTREEIINYIKQRCSLTEWLENNLDYVYEDALQGYDDAIKLYNQVTAEKDNATRHQTYDYIWKLINEYEIEKTKLSAITKESGFKFNGRGTV